MRPTERPSPASGGRRSVSARAVEHLVGPEPLRRLVLAYMTAAAGDALFTVSLAGSLFFSVSSDAARSRILVYLVLTLAPFAIVGPFVGPVLDRLPGGQRMLLAFSCIGRAAAAVLIAQHLSTLFFFPEAFAVLVLGKSASVAKSVLVPWLVGDETLLVAANARISRMTTVAGGIMFGLGAGLIALAGASVVLLVAGGVYALAMLLVLRIPPPHIPDADPLVEEVELRGDSLRLAANSQSVIRAAMGFLAFLLAFNLKAEGEPTWVYGVAIAVTGAAGFAGTFVAVLARRRFREEALLAAGLVVPGALALLGAVQYRRSSAFLVAGAVGLASNVGHHAFSSITQRLAPDAEKGRAFARFESQFQLAWVIGALIPVLIKLSSPLGLAGLGVVMCGAAVFFGTATRAAHHHEVVLRARLEPAQRDLPASMLTLARALHAQGAERLAVITAVGAVRAAGAAAGLPDTVAGGIPELAAGRPGELDSPADRVDGRLGELWRRAATGTGELPEGDVEEAIRLASELVRCLTAPRARRDDRTLSS